MNLSFMLATRIYFFLFIPGKQHVIVQVLHLRHFYHIDVDLIEYIGVVFRLTKT